jgi:hypothetical protein
VWCACSRYLACAAKSHALNGSRVITPTHIRLHHRQSINFIDSTTALYTLFILQVITFIAIYPLSFCTQHAETTTCGGEEGFYVIYRSRHTTTSARTCTKESDTSRHESVSCPLLILFSLCHLLASYTFKQLLMS